MKKRLIALGALIGLFAISKTAEAQTDNTSDPAPTEQKADSKTDNSDAGIKALGEVSPTIQAALDKKNADEAALDKIQVDTHPVEHDTPTPTPSPAQHEASKERADSPGADHAGGGGDQ